MVRLSPMVFLITVFSTNVIAASYNEQALKTLFTTPTERQAINAERRGSQPSNSEDIITGPTSVQINGIVSRSNGKSVVWMNGRNTQNNTMIDGVKVYSNSMNANNSRIPVMVDGRMVYLKPGETWSEESGVVDNNK